MIGAVSSSKNSLSLVELLEPLEILEILGDHQRGLVLDLSKDLI